MNDRQRPFATLAGAALVASMLCTPAFSQDFKRPGYTGMRHAENWSVLANAPSEGGDFWDPIKYIKLSDDGQAWMSLGGSLRLRGEDWSNFGALPSAVGDDDFVLLRARFHADIHFSESVRAFVEVKTAQATDRDLPGGRRGLDVDSFDLQQAFVDFNFDLDNDLDLLIRAGRQGFNFGKQRLVSTLPWANTMRAWDGVDAIITVNNWTIHNFWTQYAPIQKHRFNDPDGQKEFFGIYATKKVQNSSIKGFDLYALGFANGDVVTINGTTGTEDRYTIGARIWGNFGESGWDYDFEGAYQFGRVGSGDVAAYMLGAQVGYRFDNAGWKPRLSFGVEMGSGDDSSGGDVETFNHLFPLGHAYFGQVDSIGRQNAIDAFAAIAFVPVEKLSIKIAAHSFWRDSSNDSVYHAGGGVLLPVTTSTSDEIAQELDFKAVYKLDPHTTLEGGYSHVFTGDFLEEEGRTDDIDFFYFQVRYVF